MKRLFVPYELAIIAKEKGFDDLCFALIDEKNGLHILNASDEEELELDMEVARYNNIPCVPAPLYQQIIDWLREKHDIILQHGAASWGHDWFYCKSTTGYNLELIVTDIKDYCKALNKAIEEAFKLI